MTRLGVTFWEPAHRMIGAPVPKSTLEVDCSRVWKEVTNYIEGDLTPEVRLEIELHLRECRKCTAIYDGTRNIVRLVADEKAFVLPRDFSEHLYDRLRDYSQQQP
jgi:predicted anti-sigma-YlaC factor YlaD